MSWAIGPTHRVADDDGLVDPEDVEGRDGVVGAVRQPNGPVGADPAAVATMVDRHHPEPLGERRVGGEPVRVGGHPEAVQEQHRRRTRLRSPEPDERGATPGELERPAREQPRRVPGRVLARGTGSSGCGVRARSRHRMATTSTVSVAPVGEVKSTFSPTFLPSSASPSGDPGRDDVVLDAPLLDRPVEVGVGVVVALVAELDDGSGRHLVALGALDDLAVLDHRRELPDASLHVALVVLGGVVVAVLLQVAELAGGLDLAGDVDAAHRGELVVLGLQPVERLLGEVVRLRHRPSNASEVS